MESMSHLHEEAVVLAQEVPAVEVPNMYHLLKEIEVADMVVEGMKVGAVAAARDLIETETVHHPPIVVGATTNFFLPP